MAFRRYQALTAMAALAALSLPGALAGPLDPPAGPIAPTAKPLGEVEPRVAINATNTPGDADSVFKITQSGSYYLVANVTGVAGKSGIEIAASNVSIDLAGFALAGVAGSSTGITASGFPTNIILRNGEISGWGGNGVDIGSGFGTLIESIVSRDNAQIGIRSGSASVVRFCSSVSNDGFGIIVFNGGVIESCYAHSNGSHGISLGFGTAIRSCVARENTGTGINCTGQATVVNCTAYDNTGVGINAASNSVVECCVSYFNGTDGITAATGCTIRGNTCSNNGTEAAGGAGVRITGSDCRIEGNNRVSNTRGVDIDGAGNIVIRNTCTGNGTNWDIIAANAVAPIANATTNGAAIVGNTYAGSLGNTDPNANFTY